MRAPSVVCAPREARELRGALSIFGVLGVKSLARQAGTTACARVA